MRPLADQVLDHAAELAERTITSPALRSRPPFHRTSALFFKQAVVATEGDRLHDAAKASQMALRLPSKQKFDRR